MQHAYAFLMELKMRPKSSRIQLTTHGLVHYLRVVDGLWADNIDYDILHKIDGCAETASEGIYSPAACTGIDVRVIAGNPDESRITTSCVEHQNLTMTTEMRHLTRFTNGFSKNIEFQAHAVNLNFLCCNFACAHQSLRVKNADGTFTKRSPTMAAGVADHIWSTWEIAELQDSN